MPRYYCDYCDTYLTHDSPSVRKQHNAGYKHKANVRTYYQQFEEQQTQSLIDQRIKEHLGQAAAFQQVGVAFNHHLLSIPGALRPRPPILPPPVMPGGVHNPGIPGMRPPVLPVPTVYTPGVSMPPTGLPPGGLPMAPIPMPMAPLARPPTLAPLPGGPTPMPPPNQAIYQAPPSSAPPSFGPTASGDQSPDNSP